MGILVGNVAAAVAGNVAAGQLLGQQGMAGVAEPEYATDLKSVAVPTACEFKSRRQHHLETPSISDLKSPVRQFHNSNNPTSVEPVRAFLAGFRFNSILPRAGWFQSDGRFSAICCGNMPFSNCSSLSSLKYPL